MQSSKNLYLRKILKMMVFSIILMLILTIKTEATTKYDSVTFNAEYYLREYPDVRKAYGENNYLGAYNHFINFGISEGRTGSPYFDVNYYLNKYQDLRKAFGTNYREAYNHFVNTGINENRSGSPYIDPEYYASKYPDVKRAFGKDYKGIYNHFYTNGIKEGRRGSKYFDVEYYLNTNTDLLVAFGSNNFTAAFDHFLTCGINELRDPSSDVNLDCYLATYKDLQNAFGENKDYKGLFVHCYTNSEADERTTRHKAVDIKEVVEPTCTEPGHFGGRKCQICGKIILKPTEKPALGHEWEDPTWEWGEDGKVTATFVCKRADHPTTLTAEVSTEKFEGETTYTAKVELDGFIYKQTKTVQGEIVDPDKPSKPDKPQEPTTHTHTYGEPTWSWSGTVSATATFKCTVSGCNHSKTVTAKADSKDENKITTTIKAATCTEGGTTTYTATVKFISKTYTDTKTTTIEKLGHNYEGWKIGENGKLEKTCKLCGDKQTREEETTTITVKKPDTTPELNDWGYKHGDSGDYTLDSNGKLSGEISEQTLNEDVYGKDKAKGYYFAVNIDPTNSKIEDLDSSVKFKPTIKVKNEDVSKTLTLEDENDSLTLLIRVGNTSATCSDECTCKEDGNIADCKCTKKVTFTVDLDGDGGAYTPVTYTIDYCNVKFEKNSKFSVSKDLPKEAEEKIKSAFEALGFKPEEKYQEFIDGVTITTGNDGKVKFSGLLPLMSDVHAGFYGEENPGYYIVFVIHTEENKTESVEVKVPTKDSNGQDITKTLGKDSFDTDNDVALLMKVEPDGINGNKEFTITVDLDGDADGYAPYTVTIDYSELKFQQNSEVTVELHKPSANDQKTFTSYGYSSEKNKNLSLTDGLLKGEMSEQELSDDKAFGADKKDGYYFDFSFTAPTGTSKDKIKIERLEKKPTGEEEQTTVKKTFKPDDFDENGNLTILYRFDKDTTGCEKCKGEEPTCTAQCCKESGEPATSCDCGKSIYYRIDWDGKEYLPTLYEIDYCGVTFEKESKVEVENVDTDLSGIEGDEGFDGWKPGENYETKFETDEKDPYTVKVTGFIPIFDDSEWDNNNPFGSAYDYYLLFKLKKPTTVKAMTVSETSTSVKFLTDGDGDGETNTISLSDFGNSDEIYVLKYVNPSKDGTTKKFKITIDFDREDKEYAPYTLTIDWSELDFQSESFYTDTEVGNSTDTQESEQHNGYIPEKDKKELETWGYKLEDAGNGLEISANGLNEKLTGSVKQQNVDKAGFKDGNGYYVVLKVYGPTDNQVEGSEHYQKGKWTVKFQDESGQYKAPVSPDDGNDFVVALIKLKDNSETKEIKYEIDWDGDGKYFLPYEETINYSELEFLTSHEVEFKDGEKTEKVTIWDGETISEEMFPKDEPKADDVYHDFAYWNKDDGTKYSEITFAKGSGNVTLVPHWNLYSDKFISDVIDDLNSPKGKEEGSQSDDFSEKFVLEKDGANVTIKVLDPNVKLEKMNETSIPGTIAYILLKDEIQEVSLTIGTDNTKTFTKGDETNQTNLKTTIQSGAKELYDTILSTKFSEAGGTDDKVTLSTLAGNTTYNNFTLSFNPKNISKTVTLAKAPEENGISLMSEEVVPTSYKFTFDSDIITVYDESSLKEALQQTEKEIYIGQPFTVSAPIEITQKVTIHGGSHVLTAQGDSVNTIFVVTAEGVAIDNISLKGSKQAGIQVDSGSLTARDITYEGENYNNPVVRASKTGATVDLKDSKSQTATKLETIEKITKYEDQGGEKKNPKGDYKEVDSTYNYCNYYNEAEHSKIFETVFYSYEGGYRLDFVRYNLYNEKVKLPTTGYDALSGFNYDGETYTAVGFTESRDYVIVKDDTELPKDVIKKDELTAKDNKHYWITYKVELEKGTEKVSTKEAFNQALAKPEITKIIIAPESEDKRIDLESELNINRNLIIIGESTKVTLKTKGISITADKVGFQRLNLEVDAQENKDALIDVKIETAQPESGIAKFSLWQATLKNVSESQTVKNAINYNAEKVAVDVRWCTFDSTKVTDNYINVDGALAEGTEIYLNDFGKNDTSNESKLNAITIKTFDSTAEAEDGETDVRIASNKLYGTGYTVKLSKDSSGSNADIDFNYNKENTTEIATIAAECESSENFNGIEFVVKDFHKVKVVYLKGDQVLETNPEGVQPVKIISEISMLQEEGLTISGLEVEGNKVSGLISTQSEDGKFYIPVELASNDFVTGVSTVSVIDPNGDEDTYLYSSYSDNGIARISNSNVMTLQLEAIKASNIKGNNGKLYEIRLDADGPTEDEYEIQEFTVDYSDVETLEELINNAAKATANSNNLKYEKDNYIKGNTDKYTLEYDKEKRLKYTTFESNGKPCEEYVFPKNNYINNSDVVIVASKGEDKDDSRVYLNDWRYDSSLRTGYGISELSLLQDLIKKDKTTINAIDRIKKAEDSENTYEITINVERMKNWLNLQYISSESEGLDDDLPEESEVKLIVTLTDDNQYISEIKTSSDFTITDTVNNLTYKNNKLNVKISDVGTVEIKSPEEMLGNGEEKATREQIIEFIEKGIAWWEKYTGSEHVGDGP